MTQKGEKRTSESVARGIETRRRRKLGELSPTEFTTIRVEAVVVRELKARARPLQDTPNAVLRRLLGIDPDVPFTGYLTVFQLWQLYLGKPNRETLKEIKRRFDLYGWSLPKK